MLSIRVCVNDHVSTNARAITTRLIQVFYQSPHEYFAHNTVIKLLNRATEMRIHFRHVSTIRVDNFTDVASLIAVVILEISLPPRILSIHLRRLERKPVLVYLQLGEQRR